MVYHLKDNAFLHVLFSSSLALYLALVNYLHSEELLNVFLTDEKDLSEAAGTYLLEDVKIIERNRFFDDVTVRQKPL